MENESKTASNAGMSAKLHCRAVGAPMIRFSWERDGSNITSVSEKYIVEQKRVNIIGLLFKKKHIHCIPIRYLTEKINIILVSILYSIDILVAYIKKVDGFQNNT